MYKPKFENIPLIFNGFSMPLMLRICNVAHDLLLEEIPTGFYPTPFVNKTNFGSDAVFKSKEMADKVEEILEEVVVKEFPISSKRSILILFHIAIENDVNDFIFSLEDNIFFLWHKKEGHAEFIIQKMMELYEKYMISYPIVLISDLIDGCTISLKEDERLIVPVELNTLVIPIKSKEEAFMKEFSGLLKRIKKMVVECKGMKFIDVKNICQGIDVKGVYYFITSDHIELTGLPFHLKNFSEIMKRRIREEMTETRVLSRK